MFPAFEEEAGPRLKAGVTVRVAISLADPPQKLFPASAMML